MNPFRAFVDIIRNLCPSFLTEPADEVREVRPFFLVVMAVLVFLYFQAVSSSPELRLPTRLILFTGLMLAHLTLYWLSPRCVVNLRWGVYFLIVQSVLAFGLTLLAGELAMIFGVYSALIGMAAGILQSARRIALAVGAYLAMGVLSLFLTVGGDLLTTWAIVTVPVTLFVIIYVVLYTRQVEARAQAQSLLRELETTHRQLTEYAARVEELTLAAERQRMARELHDTLTQGVVGLILQVEAINAHLTNNHPDRAQAIARQAISRARETLTNARGVINDLRQKPAIPHELAAAIGQEVNRFTAATGIPCALDFSLPVTLPGPLGEHTLRIIAEGLTNVARHAQASQVWVRITHAADQLEIELRDDGIGFDPAQTAAQAGHYGLLGMRERARLVGGTLQITSAPGEGAKLWLSLPLSG